MLAAIVLIVFIGQALVTLFLLERYLGQKRPRMQIPGWQHWLVTFVSLLPLVVLAVLEASMHEAPIGVDVLAAIVIDAIGTTVGVATLLARRRGTARYGVHD